MNRLKNGGVVPDVSTGSQTESPYQPGAEVRENIAEQIRCHDDIELLWSRHELHGHIVDNAVIAFDLGIFLRHLSANIQKQSAGEFHNVGLMHDCDLLTSVLPCIVKGSTDNPVAPRSRHNPDSFGSALLCIDVMLNAGVEFLGIFPKDDQINALKRRLDPFHRLSRPKVDVEVKLLSESNVDASEAHSDGGSKGAFQRYLVFGDRVECLLGQRIFESIDSGHSRLVNVPLDVDACGFDDFSRCFGDAGANPITRYESYSMHMH